MRPRNARQLLESNQVVLSWFIDRLREPAEDARHSMLFDEFVNLLRAHTSVVTNVLAPTAAEYGEGAASHLVPTAEVLQANLAELISGYWEDTGTDDLLGKIEVLLDALSVLEREALAELEEAAEPGRLALLAAEAETHLVEVAGDVRWVS